MYINTHTHIAHASTDKQTGRQALCLKPGKEKDGGVTRHYAPPRHQRLANRSYGDGVTTVHTSQAARRQAAEACSSAKYLACSLSSGQARRIGINHPLARLRGASPMPSRGLRATASSGRRFQGGRGRFRLRLAIVPRHDRMPVQSCSTLAALGKSRGRNIRPSARR